MLSVAGIAFGHMSKEDQEVIFAGNDLAGEEFNEEGDRYADTQ
jgi:hypothetical protein